MGGLSRRSTCRLSPTLSASLANREALIWQRKMQTKIGKDSSPEAVIEYEWFTLNSGQIVAAATLSCAKRTLSTSLSENFPGRACPVIPYSSSWARSFKLSWSFCWRRTRQRNRGRTWTRIRVCCCSIMDWIRCHFVPFCSVFQGHLA